MENYFFIRYADGSLEIRKRSDQMVRSLQSEAEPVPTVEDLVRLYSEKPGAVNAEAIIVYRAAEQAPAYAPTDPEYTAGHMWGIDAVKALKDLRR